MTLTIDSPTAPWPADRLREARAILADVTHQPDTRAALAARVIVRHSRCEAERRDACAVLRLLDENPRSDTLIIALLKGGAA